MAITIHAHFKCPAEVWLVVAYDKIGVYVLWSGSRDGGQIEHDGGRGPSLTRSGFAWCTVAGTTMTEPIAVAALALPGHWNPWHAHSLSDWLRLRVCGRCAGRTEWQ